ncbi:MAG: LLM class F420-dependent oxidoreductase [Gammaproteobacteria bacterium]
MVRIAIQLYPQHVDYSEFRGAAEKVESMGADVLYTWDHFFPLNGPANGKHFECWTLLAALAEVTERVRLGPMVACNSYRNPELLADMARTIDHISGGRFILGIGSGWFERDYEEYGYDFGTAPGRLKDLAAALPRIEKRLDKLNPGAMGKLPMLIGGGGEKVTLKLVAKHADIWHGFANNDSEQSAHDSVAHKNGVLDHWCEKVGRDPAAIERSIGIEIKRIQLAEAVVDAGAQEILIGLGGPKYDYGPVQEWLDWRDSKNG